MIDEVVGYMWKIKVAYLYVVEHFLIYQDMYTMI